MKVLNGAMDNRRHSCRELGQIFAWAERSSGKTSRLLKDARILERILHACCHLGFTLVDINQARVLLGSQSLELTLLQANHTLKGLQQPGACLQAVDCYNNWNLER